MIESLKDHIQAIILILTSIVSLLGAFKKGIIGSCNRLNRGKYKTFKLLKDEYIANKHNGYFAFQNYLNQRIEANLIDFIMTSPDAYSIMKRLKSAGGKYIFDGTIFKTHLRKRQYILPGIGYFISSLIIISYLSMSNEIIGTIKLKEFIFLLVIILCVFGPILINSLQSISSISSARYLEKITQEKIIKIRKSEEDDSQQFKYDKCKLKPSNELTLSKTYGGIMSHFMESERIKLRPVQKDDLKQLAELMSDREIAVLSGEVYPITESGMENFYERCQKTDERIWFVIVDKETNSIIGETGFLRIFMPWRTTDYSLMIWNRNYWNKGYGKEVAKLMLEYGFNSLNFHRIAIGVVGFNERGLRFWKSIGFKEEGKQKDGIFNNGKYSDFIMLSLLEDEYRVIKSKSQ